jgi:hypothetical protein
MRLPSLLSMLAISAQAACLWDVRDEKLYCSWGEVKPPSAEQCSPPTPEPMRSDTGSVYCGKLDTRALVQGGPGTADPAKLVLPTELNLDCTTLPAPPRCKPVKAYKDCASPNIVRSSATTDGMLCCDASVNEIRIHLKCKTEVNQ